MTVHTETALVVLVPEAEALAGPFRGRHDPAAAVGMPCHITLLYPFMAHREVNASMLAELERCFAEFAAFDFSLSRIRRFPGQILYLSPDPEEPFRRLTAAIWARFPRHPPYGGRHRDIVPHLSVAHLVGERELDDVGEALAR